jgi:hypothetical protein
MWGYSANNRINTSTASYNSINNRNKPTLTDTTDNQLINKTYMVSCGLDFTHVINTNRNVYVFGNNDSRQLGIGLIGSTGVNVRSTALLAITPNDGPIQFSALNNGNSFAYRLFDIMYDLYAPCLTQDTDILTPNGYVNITSLKNGDLILTSDNREVKIEKIYSFPVVGNFNTYPYIIPKNSIDTNYPPQDLKISGKHLIRFNNGWIQPCSGFRNIKFEQDTSQDQFMYYHIKLPNYLTDFLVINGGCVVESFGDNIPVSIRKYGDLYKVIVK